jgi:hypothetical protein
VSITTENKELLEQMQSHAHYLMLIYNVHFYTCIEVIEGLEEKYGEEKTSWFYDMCRRRDDK